MFQVLRFLVIIPLSFLIACSSGDETSGKSTNGGASKATEISAFELEHGIGPIKEVALGRISNELADQGKTIFTTKCSACHKVGERYVGPDLKDVTKRRTPEFIMNMILNPDEMVKRHPVVKELLTTYLTPMTFQNVSQEDARAILEYFRLADHDDEDHDDADHDNKNK